MNTLVLVLILASGSSARVQSDKLNVRFKRG